MLSVERMDNLEIGSYQFAMRAIAGLLLVLIMLVMCGCGGRARRKVEEGIAKSLPDIIGPARSYHVTVTGSLFGMMRGNLREIKITGREVEIKNALILSRLDVTLTNVEFDPDTRVVKKVDSTDFSATMSEEDLNVYLAKTYPNIPDLGASLRDCLIVVSAAPSLSAAKVHIRAEATLNVLAERRLVMDLKKITAGGLPAPWFARNYIEKKLNPVFDAADLGFDARIASVRLHRGSMTLTGQLNLMKAIVRKGSF